jgi:hypothetical protein
MFSDLYIRLRSLFRRASVESELNEELRFHRDRQVEKYIQSGLTYEEATRRFRLEFGGLDQVKEECRDARGVTFLETLAQDIRYALRTFRRSPVFTVTVIVTLAVGIGATTAVFSVVDRILFRSLPYAHDERIVSVGLVDPTISQEFMLGGALGLCAALSAAQLIRSLLYNVGPHEPATYMASVLLLVLVALAATLIPARAAMKVEPVVALRYE